MTTTTKNQSSSEDSSSSAGQVMQPKSLRKLIGILGIIFPFALWIGTVFYGCDELQGSVSDYHHTAMQDVFVGFLCAYAMFLFVYMGPETVDIVASKIAGFGALGIAIFPTSYKYTDPTPCAHIPWYHNQTLHMISTIVFFLTLVYMSLFLFTRTGVGRPTTQKLKRNFIFRLCGIVMLLCLVLILVYIVWGKDVPQLKQWKPMFWLEAIALFFFGVSWLVKGEAVLKD